MDDATALALALGLFSAVTLATVNLMVKMSADILVGRALLSASSAVLILPFAFVVPAPDAATWEALALTIPAHFFYQVCLVRAMNRGDLSLVFPVMRGVAPLFTAGAAFLLLNEALSPLAVFGLLVATASVIIFALPARGLSLLRHPEAGALGWAAATAVGIALYNVTDARGVRIAPSAFTYIVWLFLLDWICITISAVALRRRLLIPTLRANWRYGVGAGLLSIFSFGSALYAYRLMEAARVSALRETSVVFAAIFGAWLLKEGFGRRRVIAAASLAFGLILMQFGD